MKKGRAHTIAHDSNRVERFFRDLTENQLRHGVFTSVEALQKDNLAYIEEHSRQP
jgi:hypothetical protein